MSASLIDSDGNARQLDGNAPARSAFTAEDAKDPEKAARVIAGLLDDVAELRRRYAPRWVDFEDRDASATITLEHGFGGRVRWWVCGRSAATSLVESSSTTSDTLVLTPGTGGGLVTIRVESVDG